MDQYIGRLLDNRYEILEQIGSGGMAVVYKAKCHRLNRLVAIKILKDEFSRDEEFHRRFHAESQAVAMLSHPNIVSVYDVSTSGDIDYIVMELIDGITLKQYMEKVGVLSWRQTLHFSMQIAKALEHAHSRGIIHRDIKPHNIMVLKNGSVKVADFGIARVASAQNTLTKEALGSVHYISPEQAKGGHIDNRSDIYSLGVVMYEMITGRPPYDGDTPVSVAIQHINGGAPMPSTLNPNIPGGLEQIIMKAMSPNPDARYSSATEMLYDMEEFRKNPSILFFYDNPVPETPRQKQAASVPVPPVRRPAPKTAAERKAGVSRSKDRPKPKEEEPERGSNKVMYITICICGLLALIGLGYFIFGVLLKGVFSSTPEVTVPSFIGQYYEKLDPKDYTDFVLKDDKYEYNDEYEEGKIIDQNPKPDKSVKSGATISFTISMGQQTDTMPELKNKSQANAKTILDKLGLELTILFEDEFSDDIETGKVTRTEPEAGTTLTQKETVTVYVSKGKENPDAPMPDLTGKTKRQAREALEDLKLDLEITFTEDYDDKIETDLVIRTEPGTGTSLVKGQTVTVVISKGKETVMVPVPNVTGKSLNAAIAALIGAGLDYSTENDYHATVPSGNVISQSIENPTEVEKGTVIKLVVSQGPEPTTAPPTEAKTKVVSIPLPEHTEDITVTIYKDSAVVIPDFTVGPDKTAAPVQLTGYGVMYFDIYVNGQFYASQKVNFDE